MIQRTSLMMEKIYPSFLLNKHHPAKQVASFEPCLLFSKKKDASTLSTELMKYRTVLQMAGSRKIECILFDRLDVYRINKIKVNTTDYFLRIIISVRSMNCPENKLL